jgi:FHS family L-fucose permease-like MFS transporter
VALAPDIASSTDPVPLEDSGTHTNAPKLRLSVMALFFILAGSPRSTM